MSIGYVGLWHVKLSVTSVRKTTFTFTSLDQILPQTLSSSHVSAVKLPFSSSSSHPLARFDSPESTLLSSDLHDCSPSSSSLPSPPSPVSRFRQVVPILHTASLPPQIFLPRLLQCLSSLSWNINVKVSVVCRNMKCQHFILVSVPLFLQTGSVLKATYWVSYADNGKSSYTSTYKKKTNQTYTF